MFNMLNLLVKIYTMREDRRCTQLLFVLNMNAERSERLHCNYLSCYAYDVTSHAFSVMNVMKS